MDLSGVDIACVFASAGRGSDYRIESELILELADACSRIVAFARVHPYWGADAAADLEALAQAGVRGLKLHPFMDGAFAANDRALVHPLVRIAADHGLVVLVHSGWGFNSAPGLIADLARSFPPVSIVMGHSGRYGYHREAAVVGADLSNLYFDVAGLATPGAVEELVSLVGSDRVLLGSDHPHSPMGFEVEKIARWSDLSEHDMKAVLGLNALRLLRVERPEAGPTVTVREPGETSERVRRS
jgi:predicted TIM-barrel fold metal-dependent hydrolase